MPGVALQFPRDFGSHPQFGIEWWYVTGWLTTDNHRPLGFQVTFFRIRPQIDAANPSHFMPRQLLIAHCALSDPTHGQLWQDQRIRRTGLGLAEASVGDTNVWMDDWRLVRERAGDRANPATGATYQAHVDATDFQLDLTFTATSAPMLNGREGYSQKGPSPRAASYYYSQPQLQVRGSVHQQGRRATVQGQAWLDHEWASEYLDPKAQGWDWVGLNLPGGGALMAFEIRDHAGGAFWAGATLRDAAGHVQVFGPGQIEFEPLRRWRSPRSGVSYPVSERLRVGGRRWLIEPLMEDQEFDARLTAGALYWEGAVRARALDGPAAGVASATPSAVGSGTAVGLGYLELTGYDRPLSLR